MRKIAILLLLLPWLYAQDRVVLIIGNGAYQNQAPLRNTENDARDIAKSLKKMDFDIAVEFNANRRQMRKAIRTFGLKLAKAKVGLFYYSGHGMQVKGINYLIPVGANISAEDEVQDEAINAGLVLRKMESAGNHINIVILDACRNNPYARSFRSSQGGLAQMDAPIGSLIVYATAPGSTAADGSGRNGTFTKHFLKHIRTPNQDILQTLKKVTRGVARETGNKQIPWNASSLMEDFCFVNQSSNLVASNSSKAKEKESEPVQNKPTEKRTIKQKQVAGLKIIYKGNKVIAPGEKVRLSAKVFDSTGQKVKKFLLWQVINNDQADIGDYFYFQSPHPGKYIIKATEPESQISAHILLIVKKQSAFEYLRTTTYNCGGQSFTVKEYLHKNTGLEFVLVPAGKFIMGRPGPTKEGPIHEVNIKPFLMSKHEITQALWEKIMDTEPWLGQKKSKAGKDYPATYVTWKQVSQFCKKTGLRLPSEAEWEYACRAGTTGNYFWDKERAEDRYIWYLYNTVDLGNNYAHPVARKKPNAFGLYDMTGNVWEWCEDLIHQSYSGAPADGSAWTWAPHAKLFSHRMVRGGGFDNKLNYCYSAIRYWESDSHSNYDIGFRVCHSFPFE